MNVAKETGKAFFIGTLIFIVLGVIQYLNGIRIESGYELLITFAQNQLYAVCLYMANALFFTFLLKRYENQLYTSKHLVRGVMGAAVISLGMIFLLRLIIEMGFYGEGFEEFISEERPSFYYISFIIAIVVTAIFYGAFYYRHKQETRVKEHKTIAKAASAQFDALKNQLDPHFLFNSLNVLTSLIEENPLAATKFTTSLSKVYRYVLEQKNKELVTVAEELKFAQLYMSLIKMRFEDSIVFTLPESIANPEAKVVPLSLQLLLENAVKHNQVTPSKKLHINIYERNNQLVVENNLQPKKVVRESSGVGLQNIKQRYYLLTERPVEITQDARNFTVAIPLLSQVTSNIPSQEAYLSGKKYERAKEHVKKLKGFYGNFGMYLLFIPIFLWLNYQSGTSFPWALFPIVGWGIGVASHAAEIFEWNVFFGKDWEAKKIRQFMKEEEEHYN
ncbi:2TM domain-containing protein [Altibacter sp. HG106]|uniref:2TM domain-containing protein n=1 Tax=Altibacter sp. HG106 TaxID=3023937 RepID=UPI002350E16B|nr:2TM domain-containing protein [Altibacter sp. HG106]MDC7993820.1 2TM domain-containing protein [Altibacter sp. HG106]